MTPEQYAILNDLAAADPVAQAYVTDAGADDQALADWLNAATTKYIWRTSTNFTEMTTTTERDNHA